MPEWVEERIAAVAALTDVGQRLTLIPSRPARADG
jgi:hypothetical protein